MVAQRKAKSYLSNLQDEGTTCNKNCTILGISSFSGESSSLWLGTRGDS